MTLEETKYFIISSNPHLEPTKPHTRPRCPRDHPQPGRTSDYFLAKSPPLPILQNLIFIPNIFTLLYLAKKGGGEFPKSR